MTRLKWSVRLEVGEDVYECSAEHLPNALAALLIVADDAAQAETAFALGALYGELHKAAMASPRPRLPLTLHEL